jgi:hypothetical protein
MSKLISIFSTTLQRKVIRKLVEKNTATINSNNKNNNNVSTLKSITYCISTVRVHVFLYLWC